MATDTHTIDATNKSLGRVAAEAAHHLLGKHTVLFVKHRVVGSKVMIINAGRVRLTGNKAKVKKYSRYSGYPSGLVQESLKRTVEKKGYREVVRKAVNGMLPKNRLHKARMKLLTIEE